MSDKMRKEFEAWARARRRRVRREGTPWEAWQAAYAAGRLAGMEEAAKVVQDLYALDPRTYAEAIREAAK